MNTRKVLLNIQVKQKSLENYGVNSLRILFDKNLNKSMRNFKVDYNDIIPSLSL